MKRTRKQDHGTAFNAKCPRHWTKARAHEKKRDRRQARHRGWQFPKCKCPDRWRREAEGKWSVEEALITVLKMHGIGIRELKELTYPPISWPKDTWFEDNFGEWTYEYQGGGVCVTHWENDHGESDTFYQQFDEDGRVLLQYNAIQELDGSIYIKVETPTETYEVEL